MSFLLVALLTLQQPATGTTDCTPRLNSETINITNKVLTETSFGADASINLESQDSAVHVNAGAAATARQVRITIRNAQGQFTILRRDPKCKLQIRGGWR